MQSQISQEDS